MHVAIIGTGIAGLVTAHLLHPEHELTVYEANDYIGGHTHTVQVPRGDALHNVDTGFMVFNPVTYPHFVRLLDALGVASDPTDMSFSVTDARSGLAYSSRGPRGWFADPRNLTRRAHWRMLAEVVRFNRDAPRLLQIGDAKVTLGDWLAGGDYSGDFVERYLVPLGASIWSAPQDGLLGFPAADFVRFLKNHGLLSLRNHLPWRTVRGGSRAYVERLTAPFRDRIQLSNPVRAVQRHADHVRVHPSRGPARRFDRVVLALHADRALSILADASAAELQLLGAFRYASNDAVLHQDTRLLPARRAARASWNYRLPRDPGQPVAITYDMNRLQGHDPHQPFLVSLNETERIDPRRVIQRMRYAHPILNEQAARAQKLHHVIDGVRRTHFCGAYWGYGFHEDGVRSALAVAARFGQTLA